jgi:acetoin utilization deacetylase AcuC-like enzyme
MWSEQKPVFKERHRRTGYVFEEIYMWHSAKCLSFEVWTQPLEHWENPESKSRCNGLLEVSGIKDCLVKVKARKATEEELLRFHTKEYVRRVQELSRGDGGDAGECARLSKGGYDIALYGVGGVLAAVEAILCRGEGEREEEGRRRVDNAYCLVRPPGHHAERDQGRGFCIFNNVVLGAQHARVMWSRRENCPQQSSRGQERSSMRVAIVDYDVHHGNGTQQAFWEDPNTLFISVHQDSNYPLHSGGVDEVGPAAARSDGFNTTINIPLPPGSGKGAYAYTFDTVVIPALRRFAPDMIFVSSGFDASYADPLAAMMLSAEDYRDMTAKLLRAADDLCGGRILFVHEVINAIYVCLIQIVCTWL